MLAIDSANLQAVNAYSKVANNDVQKSNNSNNVDFHKLFEANFKKISGMSPSEIQSKLISSKIGYSRSPAVNVTISSNLSNSISELRDVLTRQEVQSQKAAIGKANLVDFMTATTEAKVTLKSIINIRDEFTKALDKLTNMNL